MPKSRRIQPEAAAPVAVVERPAPYEPEVPQLETRVRRSLAPDLSRPVLVYRNRPGPPVEDGGPVAAMLPPPFEGESPHRYYFPDKPRGHRCAWSWKWLTKHGRYTPHEIFPLAKMSPAEKVLELQDYADRGTTMTNAFVGRVLAGCDPVSGKHPRPQLVDDALHDCRAACSESPAPWDLPSLQNIPHARYRRGWAPEGTPAGLIVNA